ncbi:MAG: protein-L-isoaspartate O-methyltransferase [Parcubacteria group bacterium]|jgi:protein-L-isoaspartate(D-aspartate) O-methyltransferase
MNTQQELVDHLVHSGVLVTPRIIDAFRDVDRKDFVLSIYDALEIYADHALPIGYGQTISQPFTVAFMCEILQPRAGDHILDVGSGSGWTTTLLAHIVGETGVVRGVEIIPELVSFGAKNLAKYYHKNASIIQSSDAYGLPAYKPYDRILVSAAGTHIPQELVDQLSDDGILVMPVEHEIIRYKKDGGDIDRYEGFSFVPLINPSKNIL